MHRRIASTSQNLDRFSMLLLLILLPIAMTVGGCGPLTFTVGTTPADMKLQTTTVHTDGPGSRDRIAMIDVSGLLANVDRPALLEQGENPVSLLHEQLAHAAADSRVKAVILRLNTPGGTVTASDMMYRDIARFRSQSGKPVVTLMMDVAASGGYYVACSTDRIVAHPTTITGSIGVIIQTVNVRPALERWGVRTEAFISGPNKDVGSPLGTMTDEHRAVLDSLVDDFYARFVRIVRDARPSIPPESFDYVVDGRVMTGEQALRLGVVDHVGDLYDTIEIVRQLADLQRVEVVRYHRMMRYVASPYAQTPTQVNLLQLNMHESLSNMPVGIHYLWRADAP